MPSKRALFEVRRVKCAISRVIDVCRANGCPWIIHTSKTPDGISFLVKIYHNVRTHEAVMANEEAS